MKIGVLGFSYAGSEKFENSLKNGSLYTANIGDNAQSIATRQALARLGITEANVITVDRDTLSNYDGEPVALVMNGVFTEKSFPLPEIVTPVFMGFCLHNRRLIAEYTDWFKRFEPIGCRDRKTMALMRQQEIAAYVTGCITMTLPRRPAAPHSGRLLIVYGTGAGQLPPIIFSRIPNTLLETAELIFHRVPCFEFPLSTHSRSWLEKYEEQLLDRYRNEASLVLTPLLHVASPCIGMGIPVVIFRKDLNARFSFLQNLMKIHTPADVAEIDWDVKSLDVSTITNKFIKDLSRKLSIFTG